MNDSSSKPERKEFHIDGGGCGPDGRGSKYAFVRLGTEKQFIKRKDNLTNNEAEYYALRAVIRYLAEDSRALISTDSQIVSQQFAGKWAVRDEKLAELLSRIRELIELKHLHIEVVWIPRGQNMAGKLLERKGRSALAV
jgi:ribonuclease HI